MNIVDAVLAVLLLVGAWRGYWRGFVREFFALTGIVVGLVVAFRLTPLAIAALQERTHVSASLQSAVAFVAVFVLVDLSIVVLGVIFDRGARGRYVVGINRIAGAALGFSKGAAVLAAALLFVHLFPVAPTLDAQIMRSHLGRPMVTAAGSAIHLGLNAVGEPPARS